MSDYQASFSFPAGNTTGRILCLLLGKRQLILAYCVKFPKALVFFQSLYHTPMPASADFELTATTLFGLEEVLADELNQLGARQVEVGTRAVTFRGDMRLVYEANLWCRTAIRILRPFASFRARDEKELYRKVSSIDWTDYLDVSQTLLINSVVSQSTFEHSLYVSQLTKDAIVDQFRRRYDKRPSVDVLRPDVRLNLHMYENQVTLSLDASGDSLHRRGYRLQTNVAPLNEVLAAGIILLTGWDKKKTFIDPMCGSGTLVAEAAMIARNIAPGLYRQDYAFMRWKDYDATLYRQVYQEAVKREISGPAATIIGSDLEPDYIRAARKNLENAELENYVELQVTDIREIAPPATPGVLVTNPPYGERINADDLNILYKQIGDVLKSKLEGWDAFIFTGNLEAAKHIGLKTSRRIPLYNGKIECRLFKYELYRGSSKASVGIS
jgi:putative N6-adenine-specific DNA methylase